jgi:hypothetical protein
MIFLRGHYIIDLIAGIIFAHYCWLISERYSFLIDVKLFKIPFQKRFPAFTRSCPNCQHPMFIWSDPQAAHNFAKTTNSNNTQPNRDMSPTTQKI